MTHGDLVGYWKITSMEIWNADYIDYPASSNWSKRNRG
jgi:hypothetical protein